MNAKKMGGCESFATGLSALRGGASSSHKGATPAEPNPTDSKLETGVSLLMALLLDRVTQSALENRYTSGPECLRSAILCH